MNIHEALEELSLSVNGDCITNSFIGEKKNAYSERNKQSFTSLLGIKCHHAKNERGMLVDWVFVSSNPKFRLTYCKLLSFLSSASALFQDFSNIFFSSAANTRRRRRKSERHKEKSLANKLLQFFISTDKPLFFFLDLRKRLFSVPITSLCRFPYWISTSFVRHLIFLKEIV